jgi:cytochrome c oxidase cbb3-type subunit 3
VENSRTLARPLTSSAITTAVIFTTALISSVQPLRSQSPSDLESGRKIFEGRCVTCHGFEGAGGDAPNLKRPTLDRAPDDDALRAVIVNGLPGKGMPKAWGLTSNEIQRLVSYVRSLGRSAPAAIAGDPQRGREIYKRMACVSCHIVKGQGNGLGPELTEIGQLRGAAYLREAIVNPGTRLSSGTTPIPGRGFSEFLPVLVVGADGREVRGVRINEDSFTIQLRDGDNQFYSFRKADLLRIERQTVKSLMPSFADKLRESELDDLVAYLLTLKLRE